MGSKPVRLARPCVIMVLYRTYCVLNSASWGQAGFRFHICRWPAGILGLLVGNLNVLCRAAVRGHWQLTGTASGSSLALAQIPQPTAQGRGAQSHVILFVSSLTINVSTLCLRVRVGRGFVAGLSCAGVCLEKVAACASAASLCAPGLLAGEARACHWGIFWHWSRLRGALCLSGGQRCYPLQPQPRWR